MIPVPPSPLHPGPPLPSFQEHFSPHPRPSHLWPFTGLREHVLADVCIKHARTSTHTCTCNHLDTHAHTCAQRCTHTGHRAHKHERLSAPLGVFGESGGPGGGRVAPWRARPSVPGWPPPPQPVSPSAPIPLPSRKLPALSCASCSSPALPPVSPPSFIRGSVSPIRPVPPSKHPLKVDAAPRRPRPVSLPRTALFCPRHEINAPCWDPGVRPTVTSGG